jgi:hypothetical protein
MTMTDTTDTTKQPRFIKPENKLKLKVGHGGISPELLKQCQEYIDTNPVDFTPYAQDLMEQAAERLAEIKSDPALSKDKKALQRLVAPIMSLKANGGMFNYPLISMIADIGLQFLDRLNELNEDGQEIVEAHNNSISLILKTGLKGYAGKEGQQICDELQDACNRYYKKYKLAH